MLKLVSVPYSDFSWNDTNKYVEASGYSVPSGYRMVGLIVYPHNGGAVLQAYTVNDVLRVTGWVPLMDSPIHSGFEFVCRIVCAKA